LGNPSRGSKVGTEFCRGVVEVSGGPAAPSLNSLAKLFPMMVS